MIETELSLAERVAVGRKLHAEIRAARKHHKPGGGTNWQNDPRDTREIVGERIGMSGRQWDYLRYVVEQAELYPEFAPLRDEVYAGKLEVQHAWARIRLAQGQTLPKAFPLTRHLPPGHRLPLVGGAVEQRRERMRQLAMEGYRTEQIAQMVNLSRGTVRSFLSEERIPSVTARVGKRRRIDPTESLANIVANAQPSTPALAAVYADFHLIDPALFPEWCNTLERAIRVYRELKNRMEKGNSHGIN